MKNQSRTLGQGWKTFYIDSFECHILSFDETSEHGINLGRISKLSIVDCKTKKCVCSYDRGWDILPAEEVKKVCDTIIKKYN